MRNYESSLARYRVAQSVLAGGVSSNFRYHSLPAPLAIERGEGAYVWDADGNRYIDFVLGNGPAFLGHSPAPVIEAVQASLAQGQALMAALRGQFSGLCQPTYVIDIPGGWGKSPIGPGYLKQQGDSCYGLLDYRGEWHTYQDA